MSMFIMPLVLAIDVGTIVFVVFVVVAIISSVVKKNAEQNTRGPRPRRKRGASPQIGSEQNLQEMADRRIQQLQALARKQNTGGYTKISQPPDAPRLIPPTPTPDRPSTMSIQDVQRQRLQAGELEQQRQKTEDARRQQAARHIQAQQPAQDLRTETQRPSGSGTGAGAGGGGDAAGDAPQERTLSGTDTQPGADSRFDSTLERPTSYEASTESPASSESDPPSTSDIPTTPIDPDKFSNSAASLSDAIEAILGADRFGGQRDQVVGELVGEQFQFDLEVKRVDRTLASGLETEFHSGRTVVGDLPGSDRSVAILFDESLNEKVEKLSIGARLAAGGVFDKWDDFYERPQILADQLET